MPSGKIEWFSVCRREVYAIGRAVQQHGFEELVPFAVIAGKVQRMSTMREFRSLTAFCGNCLYFLSAHAIRHHLALHCHKRD